MIIHGYIMLFVGVLEVVLLVYLWRHYQRTPIIHWFMVVVAGVILYVVSNGITYLVHDAHKFFHLTQWYAGVILTAAFLMFVLHFPYRLSHSSAFESWLFWVPTALFIPIIYFTDFIVSLNQSFIPAKQNYGQTIWIFPVFFAMYWALSLSQLVVKLHTSDGVHKWQIHTFLFGAILVPLVASTIFDIVLPISNIVGYGWIGPEASIIWLGFTTYIIFKK